MFFVERERCLYGIRREEVSLGLFNSSTSSSHLLKQPTIATQRSFAFANVSSSSGTGGAGPSQKWSLSPEEDIIITGWRKKIDEGKGREIALSSSESPTSEDSGFQNGTIKLTDPFGRDWRMNIKGCRIIEVNELIWDWFNMRCSQ